MTPSDMAFSTTAFPSVDESAASESTVPTLTIISHPHLKRAGDRAYLMALPRGKKAGISRTMPDFTSPTKALGKPLADVFMSREPFFLKPSPNGLLIEKGNCRSEISVRGVLLEKSCTVSNGDLERGVVLCLADRIVLLLHFAKATELPTLPDYEMIGHSPALHAVRAEIQKVADLRVPVLLCGASGTGKELVAKAIHQAGKPGRPFISVNMGAIPASLAAAALFGALKGSFTGADRHQQGYFKAAEGGTLFLDEIGEAPLEIQVLLLRVLETGEMTPVGSQTATKINVRLIAATDADLAAKIRGDSFKAPLFHRLSGYQISLPHLCDRLEDFGRLFVYFAEQELAEMGKQQQLIPKHPRSAPWLPADLVIRLLQFPWPGNVRQLRNVVRQLVIGCRGEAALQMTPKVAELLTASIAGQASQKDAASSEESPAPAGKHVPLRTQSWIDTFQQSGWEIKATADQLGISRSTLYEWISRAPGIRNAGTLSKAEIAECLAQNQGQVDLAAASLKVSGKALRRRMTKLGMG